LEVAISRYSFFPFAFFLLTLPFSLFLLCLSFLLRPFFVRFSGLPGFFLFFGGQCALRFLFPCVGKVHAGVASLAKPDQDRVGSFRNGIFNRRSLAGFEPREYKIDCLTRIGFPDAHPQSEVSVGPQLFLNVPQAVLPTVATVGSQSQLPER
jgi:hypothetical protein